MIYCLISFSARSVLAIQLYIIDFHFNIISHYRVIFAVVKRHSVSILRSLIIIIIIITPLEFFTSVLADGFSLEFE